MAVTEEEEEDADEDAATGGSLFLLLLLARMLSCARGSRLRRESRGCVLCSVVGAANSVPVGQARAWRYLGAYAFLARARVCVRYSGSGAAAAADAGVAS